jgi:signal transduction histidine kinase/pSer/pThr/pTyr-binding forkhead associated (FHA) protein
MSKLYILNGPAKDQSFDLKFGVTIVGRGAETDIQIKDKHVTRQHLRITRDANSYFVEDLRSTNGTFVDGKMIEPGKNAELGKGTPVRIGDTFFSLGTKNTDVVLPTELELPVRGPDDTLVMDRRMSRLKNLELIYRVSSVFMHSLNLRQTLEQILTYICDLLKRIDLAAVILVDPETEEILEVISRSMTKGDQSRNSYSKTIVKRVIREKNAVMLSEMGDGSEKIHSESMKFKKIKSVMCVPLLSRSKIQGVIYVDSVSRLYGFRKEDLSLIAALSSPAAMAIENALLYSNLEKKVEARTKDLLETKESLKASESRFRAIFENMTSGVGVYEAVNGGQGIVILDINQAYRRIEGIPDNKKILKKNLLDVFPSYKGTDIIKVLRKVWETGIPEKNSLVFYEGEEIIGWRDYYVYRLLTNEIVAIFDDMTEKKRAEREQKILQEQLFLSQKMESIGALAGGIAHNFRNILQAITGNTEYLEMISNGKEEIKEITGNIFDSVEKGVDLINNILQFSRKDKEYKILDIDLADIIKRTYGIISRVFNKNIDIQINVERNLFTKGNPSLLSQVFMNLFNNASDAMPEGGTLIIGAKRKGESGDRLRV